MNTEMFFPNPTLIDPFMRNWLSRKARVSTRISCLGTRGESRITHENRGRYRATNGYYVPKVYHTLRVHACLLISGRKLSLSRDVLVAGDPCRLQTEHMVPFGWKWDIDANGLRIVSRTDSDCDCHFDYSSLHDLQCGRTNPADYCVVAIENRDRRNENARQQLVNIDLRVQLDQLVERGLVYVTMHDSLLSGNCPAGTAEYAQRNGLRDVSATQGIDARIVLRAGQRGVLAARMAAMRLSEVCI